METGRGAAVPSTVHAGHNVLSQPAPAELRGAGPSLTHSQALGTHCTSSSSALLPWEPKDRGCSRKERKKQGQTRRKPQSAGRSPQDLSVPLKPQRHPHDALPHCGPFSRQPQPTPTLPCPVANFWKDISGVFLLDSHFLCINSLIDADSLKNRSGGGVRWEGLGLPRPPALPAPVSAWVASRSTARKAAAASCQLDAAHSRMPFWDVPGICQVQPLPGFIYSA